MRYIQQYTGNFFLAAYEAPTYVGHDATNLGYGGPGGMYTSGAVLYERNFTGQYADTVLGGYARAYLIDGIYVEAYTAGQPYGNVYVRISSYELSLIHI